MPKPSDIAPRKIENPAPPAKVVEKTEKKPFVLKPHLTDKIGRNNPQLAALRKELTRKNQPNVRIRNK